MEETFKILSSIGSFLGLVVVYMIGVCILSLIPDKKWFHYLIGLFGILCGIIMLLVVWEISIKSDTKGELVFILFITTLISQYIYSLRPKKKEKKRKEN